MTHSPKKKPFHKLSITEISTRRLRKSTGQQLNVAHKHAREAYCRSVLRLVYEDGDFFRKVGFSEENRIYFYGYINRRTIRLLGFQCPDVVVAVSGHGIIGPYFVEDKNKNKVTANQEQTHHYTICGRSPHILQQHRQWFQQYGSTCPTTRRSLALLHEHF